MLDEKKIKECKNRIEKLLKNNEIIKESNGSYKRLSQKANPKKQNIVKNIIIQSSQ